MIGFKSWQCALLVFAITLSSAIAEASLLSRCMDLLMGEKGRNAKFTKEMDEYVRTGWSLAHNSEDEVHMNQIKTKLESWNKKIEAKLKSEKLLHPQKKYEEFENGFPLNKEVVLKRFGKIGDLVPENFEIIYHPYMDFYQTFLAVNSNRRILFVSHGALYSQTSLNPTSFDLQLSLIHELVHIAFHDHRLQTGHENWGYKFEVTDKALRNELEPYLGEYSGSWNPEEIFTRLVTGLITADYMCEGKKKQEYLDLGDLAMALSYHVGHTTRLNDILTKNIKDLPSPELELRPNSVIYKLNFDGFRVFVSVPKSLVPSRPSVTGEEFLATFNEDLKDLKRITPAISHLGPTGTLKETIERMLDPSKEMMEQVCNNRDAIWKALDETGINLSRFRNAID